MKFILTAPGARRIKHEAVFPLTLLTVALCVSAVRADPPAPGKLIDRSNLDIYSPYTTAALKFAIAHGLSARVIATSRIDWPVGFQEATEKYSGQASLDDHDQIQNYIAGMPFPLIHATDPRAATKIAYNWRWGPFVPDDVSLLTTQRFVAWTTDYQRSTLTPDDKDRDYRGEEPCDELIFLRYSHRTKVDPRPNIASDTALDWKARGNHCGGRGDVSVVWTEQANPPSVNYTGHVSIGKIPWFIRWALRSMPGDFPSRKCTYGCTPFWWEYVAPITAAYRWRLSGERPILACLSATRESAGISRVGNEAHFDEEPFELRTAYVLEAVPLQQHVSILGGLISIDLLHATVYIDSETYLFLGGEFQWFDLVDASVPLWSRHVEAGEIAQLMLSNELFVPGDRPEFLLSLNIGPGMQRLNKGDLDASSFEIPR